MKNPKIRKALIPIVDEIISFLKKRYQAEVVIIVGSRAVGDYKPGSDWDIYMFSKKIRKDTPEAFLKAMPQSLYDEDLDLYKYDFDSKKYPAKLWKDLRNSEVVLDSRGVGKRLKTKAARLYKQGPPKWTKVYAQGRILKARRYMKKFEDNLKHKSYGDLFLRICYHYTENVIDWWFGIRQEWPLRPQQAFPYIKKKDPRFYKQLEIVFSDKTSFRKKIDAFKEIHSVLFNSREFKRLIK